MSEWHGVGLWGCVVVGLCGCVIVWLCGFVAVWLCGRVAVPVDFKGNGRGELPAIWIR